MSLFRAVSTAAVVLAATSTALPAMAIHINLKKAVTTVVNIGKDVAKLPNPITTPIQIITGHQNPLQIKEYVAQQGQALGDITNTARTVAASANNAAGDLVSQVAGDKARIVYDIVTGPDRIQREFTFTATQQAASLLQGQDPLISIAMPLAAALRDAHSQYGGQAQPIPDEVKTILAPLVPADVLGRARYTVGTFKLSLPDFIEGLKPENAVTIDDVIVFPRQPDFSDTDDLAWLVHELKHVKQFQDWGIDEFAFNYLKNYHAVEDQAYAAQSYAASYLSQILKTKSVRPVVTYSSAMALVAKTIQTPVGQPTTVFVEAKPGFVTPDQQVYAQPVFQHTLKNLVASCVVNGELTFITNDNVIVSPWRGNAVVGTVTGAQDPRCAFDVYLPGWHACAMPSQTPWGPGFLIGAGYTMFGGCIKCTPQTCPQ
jgi:hypothetical protein